MQCGTAGIKNHDRECSANLRSDASIGREDDYVLRAAESLCNQGADSTSMTKDRDASVRKALLKFFMQYPRVDGHN